MNLAMDFVIDEGESPPLVHSEVDKEGDVIPHLAPGK
jgi:hypothetical protein